MRHISLECRQPARHARRNRRLLWRAIPPHRLSSREIGLVPCEDGNQIRTRQRPRIHQECRQLVEAGP